MLRPRRVPITGLIPRKTGRSPTPTSRPAAWALGLPGVLAFAGPRRFSSPEYATYRTLSAAILVPGYLANTWLLRRQRRGRRSGEMDERDDLVARRASEVTLLIAALLFFSVYVALWEVYKHADGVPAGWSYILAYLIVVTLSLVHAAARLVCDVAGSTDG